MIEDYADLFCELFDGLDPVEFRSAGESWIRDAAGERARARVRRVFYGGNSHELEASVLARMCQLFVK